MPKKSSVKDKNIFLTSREEAENGSSTGFTRAEAAEKLYISADRLFDIEHGNVLPKPDEIINIASLYRVPALPNYYCTHICEIGQKYVPQAKEQSISQIMLEMIVTLNTLNAQKERLAEITVDGQITDDEVADFKKIRQSLNQFSSTLESFKIWLDEHDPDSDR